jgi:DNA-binding transcriptional ArsR family regulator
MSQRDQKGRFAYPELDRVLHERARLGILTCLLSTTSSRVTFNDLRELCDLTDGNLSRHLKALEEADVVHLEREQTGSRPLTWISFTKSGRKRFLDYVEVLESIVQSSSAAARTRRGGDAPAWPLRDGRVPA